MGGVCVLLVSLFCIGWVLCMLLLSCLLPTLIIYNAIVGIVCLILYFYLKRKRLFEKYRDGYKHVFAVILKFILLIYAIISLLFSTVLGVLCFM